MKFMAAVKEIIKKILPKSWLLTYHYWLAQIAAMVYWYPSKKMIVIGVTGTNGKSTTVNLIAKILEETDPAGGLSSGAGNKVGIVSTVNFKVGDKEWLNPLKMTMPGRFYLQRLLRQMVRAGCGYVVLETSSEGLLQYRHLGIDYDAAVFTNLAPEHLDAHGGFDNYKKTKLKLPAQVANRPTKKINGRPVKRVLVANLDDRHAADFLDFEVDERYGYTAQSNVAASVSSLRVRPWRTKQSDGTATLRDDVGARSDRVEAVELNNFKISEDGISFAVQKTQFNLKLLGTFDLYNAGAAITTAQALGIELETARTALEKVDNVPGRLERIDRGQPFVVVVDYSPEPASLSEVYKTLKHWNHNKIIHLLGSTGGGRDTGRRPILGYIAGTHADYVVVTNEDPYDDDPQEIIDDVAVGAVQAGLTEGEEVFKFLDRREGIKKALSLAQGSDLVLITGKGSEQAMVVKGNKKIPWDDREVVREELEKLGYG